MLSFVSFITETIDWKGYKPKRSLYGDSFISRFKDIYHKHAGNKRKVADELGVTPNFVSYTITRHQDNLGIKPGKPTGRPRLLDDETKQKIFKLRKAGVRDKYIAQRLNIHKSTISAKRKELEAHPDYHPPYRG